MPDFDILKMNAVAIVLMIIITISSLCTGIGGIISVVIGYLCGDYAATRFAPKINGSQTWAFMIPYAFSVLGLFCYWVYYRIRLDGNPKKESEKIDELFDPAN